MKSLFVKLIPIACAVSLQSCVSASFIPVGSSENAAPNAGLDSNKIRNASQPVYDYDGEVRPFVSLDTVRRLTNYTSPQFDPKAQGSVIATATASEVQHDDPWNIVLKQIFVTNNGDLFSKTGEVALLIRVNQGSAIIRDKWILTRMSTNAINGHALEFSNINIWAGKTDDSFTLDLKLVDLDGADKKQRARYLALAKQLTGVIPQYGALAGQLAEAGMAINENGSDTEVLLSYEGGFNPSTKARYGYYAMLEDKLAQKTQSGLWYKIPVAASGDKQEALGRLYFKGEEIKTNYVVIQVGKGAVPTFALGISESADELLQIADKRDQESLSSDESFRKLLESFSRLSSSTEARAIVKKAANFERKDNILESLNKMKTQVERQSQAEFGGPKLSETHLQDYYTALRSFIPGLPISTEIGNLHDKDTWTKIKEKASQVIDTSKFDPIQFKWVPKT